MVLNLHEDVSVDTDRRRKKKILVTGLCLSRNRGGPAMAISFMSLIGKHLPAEFTFAVDPRYLSLESQWAALYDVEVVPKDTILQMFSQSSLYRAVLRPIQRLRNKRMERGNSAFDWPSIHKEYVHAFGTADCVVNLNGIAFVGEETRSWLSSLAQRTDSIYAKKLKKPFFRFIQSYGPFKDWRVKLLAKLELRRLPCIMARGRLAESHCREVAGNVPVYKFPDVAITLPCAEEAWLQRYLAQFNLKRKDYVVLSPSSVISSMPTKKNSSVGHKHITLYAAIAKYYLSLNKTIIFLPHMTSPDLVNCDRLVCKKVMEMLNAEDISTTSCYSIDDELDCRELKALIKGSELAIVSRYHALVAALSTGVPVVSIGWNEKYQDLLEFYGSGEFAVDARIAEPDIVTDAVVRKADGWTNERIKSLEKIQPKLEKMVERAGKICADWILEVTG